MFIGYSAMCTDVIKAGISFLNRKKVKRNKKGAAVYLHELMLLLKFHLILGYLFHRITCKGGEISQGSVYPLYFTQTKTLQKNHLRKVQ